MRPIEAFLHVFRHWSDFRGRARRSEFWWFNLLTCVVQLLLVGIGFAIFPPGKGSSPAMGEIFLDIYVVIAFIPSLAVTVRRLHDVGRSGWWMFFSLIPFIGPIVLLVFQCTDSIPGPNQWGPNPKEINYDLYA